MIENNTKAKIEVMQAFEDGGAIEFCDTSSGSLNQEWSEACNPRWSWAHCNYRIKPEPENLLDRIKAQYPDFEVVELEWTDNAAPDANFLQISTGLEEYEPHSIAQSMKGFYTYIYEEEEDSEGDFYNWNHPTYQRDKYSQVPVAALFSRVK